MKVVCAGVDFGGFKCPNRSSCRNWDRNHLGEIATLQSCRGPMGERLAYVPTESGVRG